MIEMGRYIEAFVTVEVGQQFDQLILQKRIG